MRVQELERRTGLSRHTLRFYEREGLLHPPRRTARGYRIYDDGHLAQLRFIAIARDLGFGLREIAEALRAQGGAALPGPVLRTHLLRRRERLAADLARLREQSERIDEWLQRLDAASSTQAAAVARSA
jgi:DNA-binding transcriptional MerR regulator